MFDPAFVLQSAARRTDSLAVRAVIEITPLSMHGTYLR